MPWMPHSRPHTVHLPRAHGYEAIASTIRYFLCWVALWARVFLGGFVLRGTLATRGLSLATAGSLAAGVTLRSRSCFSQQKESWLKRHLGGLLSLCFGKEQWLNIKSNPLLANLASIHRFECGIKYLWKSPLQQISASHCKMLNSIEIQQNVKLLDDLSEGCQCFTKTIV